MSLLIRIHKLNHIKLNGTYLSHPTEPDLTFKLGKRFNFAVSVVKTCEFEECTVHSANVHVMNTFNQFYTCTFKYGDMSKLSSQAENNVNNIIFFVIELLRYRDTCMLNIDHAVYRL